MLRNKRSFLRNDPLLTYELTNLRIVTLLVLICDVFCHLVMDSLYFTGETREIVYFLRLYIWTPSVVILFILSYIRGAQYYLKSAILIAILLHGHLYVTATFFLGIDGVVYGGMFIIITAVLSYFVFKFSPKTKLCLVGSMVVIYWISTTYNILINVPYAIDSDLAYRIIMMPRSKEVLLALFGSTTVIILLDFSYYQMSSIEIFLHDSSSQVSEYDTKRLLWLENMSRLLKHEMDNSILSINMEISNAKKNIDLHQIGVRISSIEDEVGQIERLVSVITQANEIEKSLVPRDLEKINVNEYFEKYVENYTCSRDDVEFVYNSGKTDAVMLCDISLFSQMLDKVVSNCVDFSESNSSVELSYFNRRNRNLVIEITNTGPNIENEHIPFLFEIFNGRSDGGHSGLGLFIAKTIVEYHSGIIEAFNSEAGPVFRITIPAAIVDPQHSAWRLLMNYFNRQ